jgi:hypothetical protein
LPKFVTSSDGAAFFEVCEAFFEEEFEAVEVVEREDEEAESDADAATSFLFGMSPNTL